MKSFALAMLFASCSAIKVDDDAYGRNGEGWVNSSPEVDLDRINITVTKPGKGKTCDTGDWVTFHYKAYLKTSGRLVADTKQTGQGLPLTIALGQGQTFRCFEVGFTKLTQGSQAVLNCPYDMAWGNAFTWPAIGGEPIPLHSDIDFKAEIEECHRVPARTAKVLTYDQPVTTTMEPDTCFYLHLVQSDHTFEPLVLTCLDKSENCKVDHFLREDPSQQFKFNSLTNAIQRVDGLFVNLKPGRTVELGSKQKTNWWYNQKLSTLETAVAGAHNIQQAVGVNQVRKWQELTTFPYTGEPDQETNRNAKWRIEYCGHERF